jgi:hypothetical protein
MITWASDRGALRLTLVLGAAYDLALALFILTLGRRVLSALGHPVPEPGFYFTLATLPLLLFPVLYVAAAWAEDIDAFRAPVLWARAGGGLILLVFTVVLRPGAMWLFLLISLIDLVWAGLHAGLWRGRAGGVPRLE